MKAENVEVVRERERELYSSEYVKGKKGITLVALVITIIILIILSTVTITAVLGDNGLIGQAKIARNLTEESIISENEKMNKLAQEYANLLAEESETPEPDLRSEIEKARDEETVFNTKTKLSDIHGNEVTVPAEFKIAKDTGLTVQQGVVIEDVNASKVAINTYKDSSSVKSDLMNSYAWDTAIVYIQEAGNDNYANLPTDGKFINTGLGTDEVCKINDLAFNCSEWITEYSDKELGMMPNRHNYPTVWRGEYYTAFRVIGYMTTDGAVRNISFRLCLYM